MHDTLAEPWTSSRRSADVTLEKLSRVGTAAGGWLFHQRRQLLLDVIQSGADGIATCSGRTAQNGILVGISPFYWKQDPSRIYKIFEYARPVRQTGSSHAKHGNNIK